MTKTTITKLHAVYTTINERGVIGELVGVCSTKKLANQAAKNKGWYGGTGEIKSVSVLQVEKGGRLVHYLLADPKPIVIDNVERV